MRFCSQSSGLLRLDVNAARDLCSSRALWTNIGPLLDGNRVDQPSAAGPLSKATKVLDLQSHPVCTKGKREEERRSWHPLPPNFLWGSGPRAKVKSHFIPVCTNACVSYVWSH